jgi:hypothetical protein
VHVGLGTQQCSLLACYGHNHWQGAAAAGGNQSWCLMLLPLLLPCLQGVLPNLVKLAPAAGISWFVFEETKLMMGVDPRS